MKDVIIEKNDNNEKWYKTKLRIKNRITKPWEYLNKFDSEEPNFVFKVSGQFSNK